MNHLLEKLLTILEEETLGWESVDRLLRRKKTAVISADVATVERTSREMEMLTRQLEGMEGHRRKVVEDLASALGYSSADLNLNRISALVDEPYGLKLARCRLRMLQLLEGIQILNESVRALISHAIQMVGISFSVLNNMMTPHTVYGGGGTAIRGNQSGRLLSQNI